jgi:hypothetical protein
MQAEPERRGRSARAPCRTATEKRRFDDFAQPTVNVTHSTRNAAHSLSGRFHPASCVSIMQSVLIRFAAFVVLSVAGTSILALPYLVNQ